jgi:hypothetical protein
MSTKLQESSDPINRYVSEHSLRLTSEQNELIEYTKTLPGYYLSVNHRTFRNLSVLGNLSGMLGSLDEAQFFQVIIKLMGCKRCSKIALFSHSKR